MTKELLGICPLTGLKVWVNDYYNHIEIVREDGRYFCEDSAVKKYPFRMQWDNANWSVDFMDVQIYWNNWIRQTTTKISDYVNDFKVIGRCKHTGHKVYCIRPNNTFFYVIRDDHFWLDEDIWNRNQPIWSPAPMAGRFVHEEDAINLFLKINTREMNWLEGF